MAKRTDAACKGPDAAVVELGDAREGIDLEAYQEYVRLCAAGEPAALVQVIGARGSAPRGMGATMTVRADGTLCGTVGGGNLELFVTAHALEAIRDGRPRRLHYDYTGGKSQNVDKACKGTTDFFVLPALPRPKLCLMGGGHVAQALAPMAVAAGFSLTVLDDRPGFLDPARFPREAQLQSGDFSEAIRALDFDDATYVAIMTYGHEKDALVLRCCLRRPWRYLGMMGSRAKVAQLLGELGRKPRDRERLRRVRAPIGLDIGGRSPGEIAVSILAELIAARYGKCSPLPLSKRKLIR